MELSVSQSHSLTNGTQTNSKSLEMNIPSVSKKAVVTSKETEFTAESSSRENDCNGLMGVPITFLDKYNPDQFDIIGYTAKDMGIECTKFYEDLEQSLDGGPFVRNMKSARFSPMIRTDEKPIGNYYRASNVSGFLQKMYGRIVIKRKKAI